MLVIRILLSIALAALIHEAGHWFAARYYGQTIKFRFAWGKLWKIPVPRGIWNMPSGLTQTQEQIIALAGFGAEFAAAPFFILCGWWVYAVVVAAHLAVYNLYAGGASDFKWV